MNRTLIRTKILAAALALTLPLQVFAADDLRERAKSTFGKVEPVSAQEIADPVAQLGRALFWDTRLSADGATACASCHLAEAWGADRRPRSPDARGALTKRHSQSVLNAQGAGAGLRWVADRATGADQALGSITGSMGFVSTDALVAALRGHGYAEAFAKAYPGSAEPLVAAHYADALQAYQKTLRTPAPFDAWLAGDEAALSAGQRRGLTRFIETGCAGCHAGPLFGGGSLQRFGVLADYRPLTGSGDDDRGLFEKTGDPAHRDVFRVQPLRNVARTAPYFHDGSVADLATAVDVMAQVQLGQRLAPEAVAEIVDFLGALSGPLPPHYGPPAAD